MSSEIHNSGRDEPSLFAVFTAFFADAAMPNTICSNSVFSHLWIIVSPSILNAAYGSTVELICRRIGKVELCRCGKTLSLQALELETNLRVYTLKKKCSSMSANKLQHQPLKRSVSAGAAVSLSGLHFNPGSPFGSNVSELSLPVMSPSHVFKPIARIGGVLPPPVETPPLSPLPSLSDVSPRLTESTQPISSIQLFSSTMHTPHHPPPPPLPVSFQ
nr:transcription factor MYB44-like [Ipomoea batatas]